MLFFYNREYSESSRRSSTGNIYLYTYGKSHMSVGPVSRKANNWRSFSKPHWIFCSFIVIKFERSKMVRRENAAEIF